MHAYQEKKFDLKGLTGFSDTQISEHLKLYAGYVKNVNALLSDSARLSADEANGVAVSELRRRLGFEWNGMRLHEYYFEALGAAVQLSEGSALREALALQFGSFDGWVKDFKKAGMMRGIGWVVLCHDSTSGNLFNVWVSDHDIGHLAGLAVLIAMDVWEHAYAVDFLPTGRARYIDAFFENMRWDIIESRFA